MVTDEKCSTCGTPKDADAASFWRQHERHTCRVMMCALCGRPPRFAGRSDRAPRFELVPMRKPGTSIFFHRHIEGQPLLEGETEMMQCQASPLWLGDVRAMETHERPIYALDARAAADRESKYDDWSER